MPPYHIEITHVCAECGEPLEVVTDQLSLVRNGEAYQGVRLIVTPCDCQAQPRKGVCAEWESCPLYAQWEED